MEVNILYIFVLIAIILLMISLRIASEDERFVITSMGRFESLKGPGLIIHLPGGAKQIVRLQLGDEGEYVGDSFARFGDLTVPVEAPNVPNSHKVRINSFRDQKVWVSDMGVSRKVVTCEKCGHEMHV